MACVNIIHCICSYQETKGTDIANLSNAQQKVLQFTVQFLCKELHHSTESFTIYIAHFFQNIISKLIVNQNLICCFKHLISFVTNSIGKTLSIHCCKKHDTDSFYPAY